MACFGGSLSCNWARDLEGSTSTRSEVATSTGKSPTQVFQEGSGVHTGQTRFRPRGVDLHKVVVVPQKAAAVRFLRLRFSAHSIQRKQFRKSEPGWSSAAVGRVRPHVSLGRIHFHPITVSSNYTFIQKRFHPLIVIQNNIIQF